MARGKFFLNGAIAAGEIIRSVIIYLLARELFAFAIREH